MNDFPVKAVIDSAASITVLSSNIFEKLNIPAAHSKSVILKGIGNQPVRARKA